MSKLVQITLLYTVITTTSYAGQIHGNEGVYRQVIDHQVGYFFEYIVDTITEQCFISRDGVSEISCGNLAKRSDWKPYITWIEKTQKCIAKYPNDDAK